MLWFVIIVGVIIYLASQAGASKSSQEAVRGGSQARVREGNFGEGHRISRWDRPKLSERDHLEQSRAAWVPPGRAVQVGGLQIDGGMLYVGGELEAIAPWFGTDPALINPALPIATKKLARDDLTYWPAYADLKPPERRRYLSWLAGGRREPDVPLGYVFLFFYGLERRILFDRVHDQEAVDPELVSIRDALESLLETYGAHSSVSRYVRSLLDFLRAEFWESDTVEPPTERTGWDLPFEIRLEVGRIVARGDRIPPELAHSWVVCDPDTKLRTPATRCPSEFARLFKIRYSEKYPDGMRVREPKSRLALEHQAASRGLNHQRARVELNLPDITSISGPQKQLRTIAEGVQDELDSYSRHVGRTDDRTSVAAQALLPAELVGTGDDAGTAALSELLERCAPTDDEIGKLRVSDLAEIFPTKKPGTIYKGEARKICDLIRKLGYGIEPDTARGGQNIGQSEFVSVYRLPEEEGDAPAWSESATLLLRLGSAVAASDESLVEEEERVLERHLEGMLSLSPPQRLRFRAHLRWSLTHPASMRGVRAKAREMAPAERRGIADALLGVAGADGRIDPDEMRTLTKIYDVMGFAEEDLYSDLHELAADPGPVTVKRAEPSTEYALRKPPTADSTAEQSTDIFRLDLEKIRRIAEESKSASALLEGVFTEEEEAPTMPTTTNGLDEAHARIFRDLVQRKRWDEGELASLIEVRGLFVAGAIEVINEAAFEACGEPLLEKGDGWEVNDFAVQEMST